MKFLKWGILAYVLRFGQLSRKNLIFFNNQKKSRKYHDLSSLRKKKKRGKSQCETAPLLTMPEGTSFINRDNIIPIARLAAWVSLRLTNSRGCCSFVLKARASGGLVLPSFTRYECILCFESTSYSFCLGPHAPPLQCSHLLIKPSSQSENNSPFLKLTVSLC